MISSGWLYTDAIHMIDCPKCGQISGSRCRTPMGRINKTPHKERVSALKQLPNFNIDNYTRGTGRF